MSWITTAGNNKLDYLNPDPRQITIEDIATGISNTPRWAGQIERFYSVAEHSLLTEFLYSVTTENFDVNVAKSLLLHDATEAYMCDIPRPLKQLIPSYISIEKRLSLIISLKFFLPTDEETKRIIRKFDDISLKSEAIVRGGDLNWIGEKYSDVEIPEAFVMHYYTPSEAKEKFLKRWEELNNV